MSDTYDPYDYEYDGPPCPRCDGMRTVSCHCGGDLCVCENYGEKDCPLCFGEGVADPKRAEKYLEQEREMMAVMRKAWDSAEAANSQSPDEEAQSADTGSQQERGQPDTEDLSKVMP